MKLKILRILIFLFFIVWAVYFVVNMDKVAKKLLNDFGAFHVAKVLVGFFALTCLSLAVHVLNLTEEPRVVLNKNGEPIALIYSDTYIWDDELCRIEKLSEVKNDEKVKEFLKKLRRDLKERKWKYAR